jgi:hypothetical protein
MKVQDTRSTHEVFAAATFARTRAMDGRREPAALTHAKTMGSITTLCGLSTLSWFKFWDIAFASVTTERCPQCTSIIHLGASAAHLSSGARRPTG